jgi:hypothetical protein
VRTDIRKTNNEQLRFHGAAYGGAEGSGCVVGNGVVFQNTYIYVYMEIDLYMYIYIECSRQPTKTQVRSTVQRMQDMAGRMQAEGLEPVLQVCSA